MNKQPNNQTTKIYLKAIIILIVFAITFSNCKKLESSEKAEEQFATTEKFNEYLKTLDASKKDAAIEKFVALKNISAKKTGRVAVFQKASIAAVPYATLNCDEMALDPSLGDVEEQDAYVRPQQEEYFGSQTKSWPVSWVVCKHIFSVWYVIAAENIVISNINGSYRFVDATHGGSTLMAPFYCPLPISWSEDIHLFIPAPTSQSPQSEFKSVVNGTITVFGWGVNKKGSCIFFF